MLPYLKQSLCNLFRRPSTGAFPKGEPPKAAGGYRGRIEYHPELCVNCGMCLRVCAPQCMERTIEPLPNGDQKVTFTFDLTSCTFCGMCSDFCSRKSITLSQDYMIVGTQPEDFIVTGSFVKKAPPPKMTPEQIAELKAKAEAAKAAKAAAGGAAPAAPKPAEEARPTEASKPAEAAKAAETAKPAGAADAPNGEKPAAEAKPAEGAKPVEGPKTAGAAKPAEGPKPAAPASPEEEKPADG